MIVDILVTREDGQVRAGSIWMENGLIRTSAEPGFDRLMTNLLNDGVVIDGREISAKATPEEWFAQLQNIYSGSMLNALPRPDGTAYMPPSSDNEPDGNALYVIRYELDLAVDRATLDQEKWQKLYDRAVKAARGNNYLLQFLIDEADPSWLPNS